MSHYESEEGVASESSHSNDPSSYPAIEDLIIRTKAILSELETLQQRLRRLRQEGTVEISHFRNTVKSELGMLERLSHKPRTESTDHIARSSNLPFLEHVWGTAKRSKDLVALQKRVFLDSNTKALSQGLHLVRFDRPRRKQKGCRDNAVLVDAITDRGRTWTKVSLVTSTRLLFDLAKQGWDSGGSDYDDDEGESLYINTADDNGDVPLLKTAKELTRAAKLFRVRTKQPTVHLVLPRIRPGETPEIDKILEDCRECGAVIFCGESVQPVSELEDVLQFMARDPLLTFSETLNIDCTILLALVSDFSHAKVSKEPWFHRGLQRQVEIEDSENLLPSLLYPALGNHKLVCTKDAAKRMREIVETIGTPSEKARTSILMADDLSKSQKDLVEEMQQWSEYPVPGSWLLPISVVDQNEGGCQANLSAALKAVSSELTAINQSVFLYGWASGQTTITSNRSVVKQIENEMEKFEDLDDGVGPKIWLCPTARSLVGKEKRSAHRENGTTPSINLPHR